MLVSRRVFSFRKNALTHAGHISLLVWRWQSFFFLNVLCWGAINDVWGAQSYLEVPSISMACMNRENG